jgi:hypothetical protein
MKSRWLIAATVAVLLAVPVGASAHPLERNLGVFSGQLPELNCSEAEAGRDFFRGSVEAEYDKTDNIGSSGSRRGPAAGSLSEANSDIAFQGKRAYQGTFPGFRILDISNASKPKEIINYTDCRHPSGQGDVVIYGDIMTRSWDSSSSNGMPAGGWPCGDSRVQAGEEGLHVFDVSDPENPVRRQVHRPAVRLAHRDRRAGPANDRLIVYSTPSSGACSGIDVIEIPSATRRRPRTTTSRPQARASPATTPASSSVTCTRPACAGGQGLRGLEHERRGRRHAHRPGADVHEEPQDHGEHQHQHRPLGRVLQRRRDADLRPRAERRHLRPLPGDGHGAPTRTYPVQTDDMKSFFFFDAATGSAAGQWTLPRDQSAFENCTLHNYNVVPSKNRDILVHGSYQSGIGVLDFSDLEQHQGARLRRSRSRSTRTAFTIGGDWSSHYYNGLIWQSDITRGLLSWEIRGDALGGTSAWTASTRRPRSSPPPAR